MYELPPGAKPQVEMRVFSNGWAGADVEKQITAAVAGWNLGYQANMVSINAEFELCSPGTVVPLFPRLGELRILQPHVRIVAGLPLPPAGTLAKLYDDIVVSDRKWTEQLVGKPSRQEKRVALRTWAVALLVASSIKTIDAMREVCNILRVAEVTAVQFTGDRQRLVERVPEAQPYLYSKPPRAPLRDR
jgi:hypothetical protein